MNSVAARGGAFVRLLGRIVVLVLAGSAVAGLAFLLLGPPTLAREYRQNEIARFAPTTGHGIGQLLGEGLLLGLVAYVGRRWLRVRL